MNRSTNFVREYALPVVFSICCLASWGCGGSSVPTTIHEGGGTIPEIVDQPEPEEGKKAAIPKT